MKVVDESNIPTLEELLKLEKKVQKDGTAITIESLIGEWYFFSVWTKNNNNSNDKFLSYLLRLFSAQLQLYKNENENSTFPFIIINSISFIFLSIRFHGFGKLQCKKPILPFFFEKIELRVNERIFLSRSIPIPDEKNMPLFSIVGIHEKQKWLSARGRGGGLALWIKQ